MEFKKPEHIFLDIMKLKNENNSTFLEASVVYCDENNLEFEEFIKMIDGPILDKIKFDAFMNRQVQRKVYTISNTLPLD